MIHWSKKKNILQGNTDYKPSLWHVFYCWDMTKTVLPGVMGISVLPVQEEGVGSGGHGGSSVTGHLQRQHLKKHLKKPTSASLVSAHLRSPGIKPRASRYRTHHYDCERRSGLTPAWIVSDVPSHIIPALSLLASNKMALVLSEGWISLESLVLKLHFSEGALITPFDLVWLSRKQTLVGVKGVCRMPLSHSVGSQVHELIGWCGASNRH